MLAAIGEPLRVWINGTGLYLCLGLATLATIIEGLRGHWSKAVQIFLASLLGLGLMGMAANAPAVGSTLAALF